MQSEIKPMKLTATRRRIKFTRRTHSVLLERFVDEKQGPWASRRRIRTWGWYCDLPLSSDIIIPSGTEFKTGALDRKCVHVMQLFLLQLSYSKKKYFAFLSSIFHIRLTSLFHISSFSLFLLLPFLLVSVLVHMAIFTLLSTLSLDILMKFKFSYIFFFLHLAFHIHLSLSSFPSLPWYFPT